MTSFTVFSHLPEGIDCLDSDLDPVSESYLGKLGRPYSFSYTLLQLQHIYEQLSKLVTV